MKITKSKLDASRAQVRSAFEEHMKARALEQLMDDVGLSVQEYNMMKFMANRSEARRNQLYV